MQTCLRAIRKSDDLGHRTYNHYVQTVDSFCNWCVSTKRLLANPLLGLERLNTEVDVRHKRRALSAGEVGKLIASARESGVSIQRFSGEKRARIYIPSFMTGLRRNEIASLTPRSFALEAEQPTVTVEAVSSKRSRKDVLPLHPELVALLRDWLKGLAPTEKLFPLDCYVGNTGKNAFVREEVRPFCNYRCLMDLRHKNSTKHSRMFSSENGRHSLMALPPATSCDEWRSPSPVASTDRVRLNAVAPALILSPPIGGGDRIAGSVSSPGFAPNLAGRVCNNHSSSLVRLGVCGGAPSFPPAPYNRRRERPPVVP